MPLKRTASAIRLIQLSIAMADDLPKIDISPYGIRLAKSGYWFRALRHEDEAVVSPDRFAACMFPGTPADGSYTLIIDEKHVVYYKDLDGERGAEVFPLDAVKAGWRKLGP